MWYAGSCVNDAVSLSLQPQIDKSQQLQDEVRNFKLPSNRRIIPRFARYVETSREWIIASLKYYRDICTLYQKDPFYAYFGEEIPRTISGFLDVIDTSSKAIIFADAPPELYLLVDLVLSKFANPEISSPQFVLQQERGFETATLETFLITRPQKDVTERPKPSTAMPKDPCYAIKYNSSEISNLYSWPLIVHEGFHIVDDEWPDLYRNMHLKEVQMPVPESSDWKKELFADLLSIHFFGPVYAFSLVKKFRVDPYYSNTTHPPMRVRVAAVRKYLELARPKYPNSIGEITFSEIASSTITNLTGASIAENDVKDSVYKFVDTFYEGIYKQKSFSRFLDTWFSKTRDYIGIEKVTVADIRNWLDHGIEIAAEPRILFNFILTDPRIIASAPGGLPNKVREATVSSLTKWKLNAAYHPDLEGD